MRLNATRLGSIASSRSFGDQLYDLAGQVPGLDLNFAGTKTLDPRITFTRAGSAANAATYVDANGIIQRAVTNLLLNSEDFSAATWSISNIAITTNAAVAPTGATTADALLETTANSTHAIYATSAQTFTTGTQSIYVKPNGRINAALRFYNAGNDWHTIVFNLTGDGSVTQSSAGSSSLFSAVSSSIVNVGDGWYRISMTATQSSRTTFAWAFDLCTTSTPTLDAASGAEFYAGDVTKGVFLWGAQFQTASTVGDYVPTGATINSAPRFDHDPTTGESLGLLPEEARTNLLVRSEEFGTTWTRTSVSAFGSGSAVDVETAPDGTLTADLIAVANGISSGSGFVFQDITKAATATTYTVTAFAKAQNWNAVTLHANDVATNNNRATVTFSLATGVITTAAAAAGTFSAASAVTATPFIDGWFRVNLTFTSSTETGLRVRLIPSNSTTVTSDGTSGIYVWGAQLEAGASATSYIPTTSATVTRAADVASITGLNFSSWYNQTEGTVFADFNGTNIASGQFPRIFEFNNGTSDNLIRVQQYGANLVRASVNTAAVGQFAADNGSVAVGVRGKTAFGSALNDAALVTNGALPTVDATYLVPSGLTQLGIGGPPNAATSVFNSTIKRLTYWPTRLSNEVLQRITQ